jgi:hypothetical protein
MQCKPATAGAPPITAKTGNQIHGFNPSNSSIDRFFP